MAAQNKLDPAFDIAQGQFTKPFRLNWDGTAMVTRFKEQDFLKQVNHES